MPRATRSAADLVAAGLAPPEALAALERVAARYAVSLTPDLAGLIDPSDPHDPIARQFVPDPAELDAVVPERADPIGDDANSPCEGIVHRYPDRVLLKLAHVCAVYCRFCFRREMVGPGRRRALSPAALASALAYIRAHAEIWEVILTGGDPLILSPRRLRSVMGSSMSRWCASIPACQLPLPPSSRVRSCARSSRAARRPMWSCMPITRVSSHPRRAPPARVSSTPAFQC